MTRIQQKKNDRLLTRPQAAQKLAVSKQTIWRLDKCGQLPHVKIGRSVRYRESDIDDLVAYGTD